MHNSINQPTGDEADVQVLDDDNDANYLQKTGKSYSMLVYILYVYIL
jgi:hypothetical protein